MQKYWVPALERANAILNEITENPSRLHLIEIANRLEMNKSSVFSLLNTMEQLGWVRKEKDGTYTLGRYLGLLGASYFKQFNLIQSFHHEAAQSVERVGEAIQLAMLNGDQVFYMAKEESKSPMSLVTTPGVRLPAYCTSLGKALLSEIDYEKLIKLYPERELEALTPYTITDREQLWKQLQEAKSNGVACDLQEAAEGFFCVASPIYNYEQRIIAAVSFTMLEPNWKRKSESAIEEIKHLAERISEFAGYIKAHGSEE
jgi:IclR family transcriptional regulator, KDG regulon repressor